VRSGKVRVWGIVRTSLYGLRRGSDAAAEKAHLRGMNLELTDEQAEALIRELSLIIEYDRYRLSPHIRALKEILGMLRPEPARPAPMPPRRHYEPPSKGRYRTRR
jgi:hypothetical protein